MPANSSDKELLSIIDKMDKYYESGNIKWFDYLSKDVVVYNNTSASPFKGKGNYIEHFERSLLGAKRKLHVVSRTIQNLSDTAIVYQTMQITQDGVVANVKQSVVWTRTDEGWRVNHLHSSIIGTPHASTTGKNVNAINVINDKIASIASVLGVAQ